MEYQHTNLKGASYIDYLAASGPELEPELEKMIAVAYCKGSPPPEEKPAPAPAKPGKKELLAALCNDRLKDKVAVR
jgi:hypothetical protein